MEKEEKNINKFVADSIEREVLEEEQIYEYSELVDEERTVPLIPLRGQLLFPKTILHFDVARPKSIKAIEYAMSTDKKVFITAQKDESIELPTKEDFYYIGTVANVKQILKLPNGGLRVLVEGVYRGEITEVTSVSPFFKCQYEKIYIEEIIDGNVTEEAERRALMERLEGYLKIDTITAKQVSKEIEGIDEFGHLVDTILTHLPISVEEKQKCLETFDVKKRSESLIRIITDEINIMNLKNKVLDETQRRMHKAQKEHYLKEQMRTLQLELGDDEEPEDEVENWLQKLKKLKLSTKINDKIEKEIKRFSFMSQASAEASVIRTYIETIFELPWKKEKKNKISISEAEKILNEDHYGLEKVKERVLEYLSVVELSKELKGPILCLVGPPGTGKTSIAKSIARATSRDFTRMSLGGVRDEAEIRGHRRTYVGSMPGRVINAMKECESKNPLFLFDEIDKLSSDSKGDPSSALLEVLDPEQNKDYMDHYLEVPFDLSKVMFIVTANTTATIPRPLLDRMEVIEVTGYTEIEKMNIAKDYLIPKKVKEHGLKEENVKISEGALKDIINYYTRESGVRNLEREIANLCRKVAKKTLVDKKEKFSVNSKNLETYLGKKKFKYDIIEGKKEVGVTTGLAWTSVGGDTLFIESALVPGKGALMLTGQMGDVMQESAKIAFSVINSKADKLNVDTAKNEKKDIHIHIPEGAIPKDGPSAGVTMCLSMLSTITEKEARQDIAMTGEINLRGHVLPVGGIREKVLAAHRAGIRKVLLPYKNEKDVDEVPMPVRKEMEFVFLNTIEDAIKEVIEG